MGPRRIWSHAYFESRVHGGVRARRRARRAVRAGAHPVYRARRPGPRHADPGARAAAAARVRRATVRRTTRSCSSTSKPDEAERLVAAAGGELPGRGHRARNAAWPGTRATGAGGRAAGGGQRAAQGRRGGETAGGEPARASGAGMQRVRAMATRAASSNINVLILGETGVGKDVLARADPPAVAARRQAVRGAQLRRPVRDPDRERAVRPREGRVHRRRAAQGRPARVGQRRAPCSSTRSARCR